MTRQKTWVLSVAVLFAFLISSGSLFAQSVFATLTGSVVDPSQAVVPGAKIALKNVASGDVRRSVTNQDGYFSFTSVPVGPTYEVTIEAPGFTTYKATELLFSGAETKTLNVTMKVGTTTDAVDVVSAADAVPTVSGEKSATLTRKELDNYAIVGRNAAEFIKIMPGFSIAGTGTENRTQFTGETIGINGNGDGGAQSPFNGAYSNNGLPSGSLDITADGAHVSDPGCNCATPVNPNSEFIEEFKVLTSNFSAENSKGPAVVTSVGRSGGTSYHGSAYLSARHHAMNSNDWLNNKLGLPKPGNKYFFPGGTFSGPVKIPGTGFNKNRDKMFFFAGFENFFQTLDTGLIRATVPSAGMRTGNYTAAELRKIEGLVNGNWQTASGAAAQVPGADFAPGGIIPASQIDKTGQALMNLLPSPNADPTATGGFNYVNQIVFNQNSRQFFTRLDFNISDNTKLFVRYNFQNERQLFPVGLWWRNGNQVPYPTEIVGKNRSDSYSVGLTKVFSPTLTNEFVFGYTSIKFPNVFNDPDKVDRTKLGINFPGLFKNNVAQIPSITGWGGEFATLLNPGGFEVGGNRGLFADKSLPTISNNVTKVWGTHTTKVGGFWEFVVNNQPANGNTNGMGIFANWGGNSTGSAYADLLTGRNAQYQEQTFNRLNNIGSQIFEFFVQDDWKVNRKLTLNLGLRASRFGAWYDREGFGFAVFDPALYAAGKGSTDFNGFTWNKRNSAYRNSGFGTPFNIAPRFGFAYDLFGSGKTILRGGWGQFYYSDSQFTVGLDVSAGVRSLTLANTTFQEVAATRATGDLPTLAAGVNPNDNKRPAVQSYSFTVAQRMPGSSIIEMAYVGNRAYNTLNRAGAGPITNGINPNAVPAGALFRYAAQDNLEQSQIDATRRFQGYQDLAIANHNLYSNYNSLQVSWIRTKGKTNLNMNYTLGKSMGIVGAYDEFNLDNNYGATAADRRHVFNAAYSIELPNAIKGGGNKFAKGLINGWQFSGITQIQSGVNLTANTAGSFNLDVNGNRLANGQTISSNTIFGTPSIQLRPVLTCDPAGDGSGQVFIKQSCFALPTQRGQTGGSVMPRVSGPAFFNSDLGLYKNFNISESKRVQFRFNAYNFLNHPLWSFISGAPNTKLVANATTGRFDNSVFGIATEKQGRRVVMLTIKYYF
ncbi:hypothetical protein F183_A21700 [Bryobacterales bacterium F-183]|nr:hypothetical protein F183_A21700 [Bryobacterales bacterium F-183]